MAAGTVACNVVELVYEVCSAVPFSMATAPETNPEPLTAIACVDDPATMLDGVIDVTVGTGLLCGLLPLELFAPDAHPAMKERREKKGQGQKVRKRKRLKRTKRPRSRKM